MKKGETLLQVQTEYATRPGPRITTTILDNGRVLHKVERSLERAISSLDEQHRCEATLIRQHAEVIAIIEGGRDTVPSSEPVLEEEQVINLDPASTLDRLRKVPGVQQVFRLENDGSFAASDSSSQFQKKFGAVFKNLRELLELFERTPGVGITRQQGVYEIERDRLYLASTGSECYFVVVRRVNVTTQYEQEIKAIIKGEPVTS